jgi:hypothetical protein
MLTLVCSLPAFAQGPVGHTARGIRLGMMLDAREDLAGSALARVFGLQGEHAVALAGRNLELVTEWVGMVGERASSISLIAGIRTPGGRGYGLGLTTTGARTKLMVTYGRTLRHGRMQLPLTVAVAPSTHGASITFMTGITARRR